MDNDNSKVTSNTITVCESEFQHIIKNVAPTLNDIISKTFPITNFYDIYTAIAIFCLKLLEATDLMKIVIITDEYFSYRDIHKTVKRISELLKEMKYVICVENKRFLDFMYKQTRSSISFLHSLDTSSRGVPSLASFVFVRGHIHEYYGDLKISKDIVQLYVLDYLKVHHPHSVPDPFDKDSTVHFYEFKKKFYSLSNGK